VRVRGRLFGGYQCPREQLNPGMRPWVCSSSVEEHTAALQGTLVRLHEPGARRAYEKVGFVVEGTRRRSQCVGGRHVNSYVMGLLAEELIR
jgi:hypothetical protein